MGQRDGPNSILFAAECRLDFCTHGERHAAQDRPPATGDRSTSLSRPFQTLQTGIRHEQSGRDLPTYLQYLLSSLQPGLHRRHLLKMARGSQKAIP